MRDTPQHIQALQQKIYASKPIEARIFSTINMLQCAIAQAKKLLRQENPHFSETEIKIEFIRRYYGHELGEEAIAKITTKIREYEQLTNP